MESFTYDELGNAKTINFADYSVISACETAVLRGPQPRDSDSAQRSWGEGIGESGTIGAAPAVQNAVGDALSDLGVRHIELPLTPERVWRSINNS